MSRMHNIESNTRNWNCDNRGRQNPTNEKTATIKVNPSRETKEFYELEADYLFYEVNR